MEVSPTIRNKRSKNDYGNLDFQAKKGQHHGKGKKYKYRMCAHSGMQEKGINYWEMYAPVVQWMRVRIMLIIAAKDNLHTKSIDFVLSYPQSNLDVDIYI